ncbi:hypothetical protein HK099_004579 [Clydaea vesicula]|uniref:SF3 helicase domain-containing protein n=1 Tax=Clydaea vesicula TaxID=447962 RepID=A0AAD5U0A8_9FUNG|nr:hypothetical protein HK099_004579 [Clydaea vesicula]
MIVKKLKLSNNRSSSSILKAHPDKKFMFYDDWPHSSELDHLLGERMLVIKTMCLFDKCLVKYRNSLYIFVPSEGSWVFSFSEVGIQYLCTRLDMTNVTVNGAIAIAPYLKYAYKIVDDVKPVPRSICISSYRLKVFDSKGELLLSRVNDLVDCHPRLPLRVKGFCCSPAINSNIIASKIVYEEKCEIYGILLNVLDDDALKVLIWTIGNGLIDPVSNSKLIYFRGDGGDGKTSLIEILESVLDGCIVPLTKDYVCLDKQLDNVDLARAASSRFVSCSEVTTNDGKINEKFWKMMTGGDLIASSFGDVRLRCTVFLASNVIWYKYNAISMKWFTRRTIVLPMKRLDRKATPPKAQYTSIEKSTFLFNCIHYRLVHKSIPITIKYALMTILGSGYTKIERCIQFVECSDFLDCYAAMICISILCLIDCETLVSLVEVMSKELVYKTDSNELFIKNIALTSESYPMGVNYTANVLAKEYMLDPMNEMNKDIELHELSDLEDDNS